jgi:hypothetical protein
VERAKDMSEEEYDDRYYYRVYRSNDEWVVVRFKWEDYSGQAYDDHAFLDEERFDTEREAYEHLERVKYETWKRYHEFFGKS